MSNDAVATLPLSRAPATEMDEGRRGWLEERELLESQRAARRAGVLADSPLFDLSVRSAGRLLAFTPLWARGMRNAADVVLTRVEVEFPDLPAAFDGFRILHLTDLHVDTYPETTAAAARLVGGVEADICVLTGDYRASHSGPFDHILPAMREVVANARVRDGVFGVLGNHDTGAMVRPLESLGIRMLVNESVSIERGDARVSLTGVDDVHAYYTGRALRALETAPNGFRIALVHSPEIADVAAGLGVRLYLSGHTHGGQICLPGSRPVITCLRRFRGYAAGLWRHGEMHGFTSTGTGVSGLPVRYHSRGEVALLTLRRGPGV